MCVLYCCGFVLKGNFDNQDIYWKLVDGLREHWVKVGELLNWIAFDANTVVLLQRFFT